MVNVHADTSLQDIESAEIAQLILSWTDHCCGISVCIKTLPTTSLEAMRNGPLSQLELPSGLLTLHLPYANEISGQTRLEPGRVAFDNTHRMMHCTLLALLATQALGSPANLIVEYLKPRADSTPEFITACQAASNCKVTTDSNGNTVTEMTSQPSSDKTEGSEPGYPKTYVTFGDSSFAWGCNVHPEEVLGHLGDLCPSSGLCLPDKSYTSAVGLLKPDPGKTADPGPESATITMKSTGTYPPVMRNGMIQAMQAASLDKKIVNWDIGQKWSETSTKKRSVKGRTVLQDGVVDAADKSKAKNKREDPPPAPHVITGTCDIATFSNFVGVTSYANNITLTAVMTATVTLPNPVDGFCGAATQGIAGLGSAILGLFPGGAAAGAALGIFSGACAASQDV